MVARTRGRPGRPDEHRRVPGGGRRPEPAGGHPDPAGPAVRSDRLPDGGRADPGRRAPPVRACGVKPPEGLADLRGELARRASRGEGPRTALARSRSAGHLPGICAARDLRAPTRAAPVDQVRPAGRDPSRSCDTGHPRRGRPGACRTPLARPDRRSCSIIYLMRTLLAGRRAVELRDRGGRGSPPTPRSAVDAGRHPGRRAGHHPGHHPDANPGRHRATTGRAPRTLRLRRLGMSGPASAANPSRAPAWWAPSPPSAAASSGPAAHRWR